MIPFKLHLWYGIATAEYIWFAYTRQNWNDVHVFLVYLFFSVVSDTIVEAADSGDDCPHEVADSGNH